MKLFDIIKNTFTGEQSKIETRFYNLIEEACFETQNIAASTLKANDINVFRTKVLALSNQEKVLFIIDSVKWISTRNIANNGDTASYQKTILRNTFIDGIITSRSEISGEEAEAIFSTFAEHDKFQWGTLLSWPVNSLVNQLIKQFKNKPLDEKTKEVLHHISTEIQKIKNSYVEKDKLRIIAKIDAVLFKSEKGGEAILPFTFSGEDSFADFANQHIKDLKEEDKALWYQILAKAQKASGSKPSNKFLEDNKKLLKELGTDKFKKVVCDWFDFIINLKEKEEQNQQEYDGQIYTYINYQFISATNQDTLKGLAWMCSHFHDQNTLRILSSLAERSYKKIPGKGPAAAALGNACLYTLYKSKGLDGIGHLSRLKLRIKQNNTQNLIENYLLEAAKEQGVSLNELEEISVDDYGLIDSKKEYEIEGYRGLLQITAIGKTELSWYKRDGTVQKSVPTIVKEKQAAKLKKIKDIAKQIEITLTSQRDRIDRMFKVIRTLNWTHFQEYYFNHGLVSFIARKIIWTFEKQGQKTDFLYIEGQWLNYKNEKIEPDDTYTISLWHPSSASVHEIRKWREFLIEKKIQQPLKQAFREVYILTDAEINTRTYSNRMAAHLLRQHQFNSLAKMRGWKYSLLGAFDDGRYNEAAEIKLYDYNLKAEFWVNEVNSENAHNDTGIWNYVATDQVRFVSAVSNETVELIQIPPVIFSEIMRDIDLFVGVASVGNDPAWRDNGGIMAYRDYWQAYSFGELTEVAKTRKEILERLIPRLKIAPIAEIKDKFLIIKGKLRTYKIHIGSTNILMEPNDQYLCIVPDRSQKNITENVFLPFEGDNGLSVILSKAFLLADDNKISDSTITSQINRE